MFDAFHPEGKNKDEQEDSKQPEICKQVHGVISKIPGDCILPGPLGEGCAPGTLMNSFLGGSTVPRPVLKVYRQLLITDL